VEAIRARPRAPVPGLVDPRSGVEREERRARVLSCERRADEAEPRSIVVLEHRCELPAPDLQHRRWSPSFLRLSTHIPLPIASSTKKRSTCPKTRSLWRTVKHGKTTRSTRGS